MSREANFSEFNSGHKSVPASNTAAVVTFAADSETIHSITGVYWSYDADPINGGISIGDGANTFFDIDITSKGAGFVDLGNSHYSIIGNALVITLSAGGVGINGKISVVGYRSEE